MSVTFRRKIGQKRGSVWCKHIKPGYVSNECVRVMRLEQMKRMRDEVHAIVMRLLEKR